MDEVKTRIRNYAVARYSTLNDAEYSELLDYVVEDVVNRSLAFTNRQQLVAKYEEDLENEVDESCLEYPIPPELETSLASTVVKVFRTIQAENSGSVADTGAIKQIEDNGQSITYAERVTSYLSNSDDEEVFSGTTSLLSRYIMGKVIRNGNSRGIQNGDWR